MKIATLLTSLVCFASYAAAVQDFFRFYSNPYCNGTLRSTKYDVNDHVCRDQGHRASVWFWFSSDRPKNLKDYCFLTYPAAKCGGGCPIRALDVDNFMGETPMMWEKQASHDGWKHLAGPTKKEYGRCMHKMKAKQIDTGKDIWERSYKVVKNNCRDYINKELKGCKWDDKMSTNLWYEKAVKWELDYNKPYQG